MAPRLRLVPRQRPAEHGAGGTAPGQRAAATTPLVRVGRQAIVDRGRVLRGYELLSRAGGGDIAVLHTAVDLRRRDVAGPHRRPR